MRGCRQGCASSGSTLGTRWRLYGTRQRSFGGALRQLGGRNSDRVTSFPQATAALALGVAGALGDEIDAEVVPDVPAHRFAYIDGYGTLKTTARFDLTRLHSGTAHHVHIAGISREAIVGDGTFAVPNGQMAFAPGSSGWRTRRAGTVRWMRYSFAVGTPWKLTAPNWN
jgi:hypothetical protein